VAAQIRNDELVVLAELFEPAEDWRPGLAGPKETVKQEQWFALSDELLPQLDVVDRDGLRRGCHGGSVYQVTRRRRLRALSHGAGTAMLQES